ncbi:hypothetical protein KVR01_008543 [Diaporthe batatas]|uniref:uncharacterized protein n=1 Tax=Diaporthe batatas TaxID=748121 RepID=UPI001D056248|nr:uncharacterized protein KVR01_008543 [Diaporthe batatas]KAG8161556.1 hypothetical protein KVR01_008543 [Diaporthe batatas]
MHRSLFEYALFSVCYTQDKLKKRQREQPTHHGPSTASPSRLHTRASPVRLRHAHPRLPLQAERQPHSKARRPGHRRRHLQHAPPSRPARPGAARAARAARLDAQQVWEESGLEVRRFVACVGDGEGLRAGAVFRTTRGWLIFKLTFVVEVRDSSAVRLDPNEHQDYVWATEEECRAGLVGRSAEGKGPAELVFTTDAQRESIMRAFGIRRKGRGQ